MKRRSALLALGAAAATFAARAEPVDLAPVRAWVEHGAAVSSVRATFVQERQLRSVKRPLVSEGVFQFAAPTSFRWELGTPAKTIVARDGGGPLFVIRPEKATAFRYRPEDLAAAGARAAPAFLTAGFPRDLESFSRTFTVTEVRREGGVHVIAARPNDRRAALALRKIVFTIDAASHRPRSVYLRFRDSSSITTRFTSIEENAPVPPSAFRPDLGAYQIEDAKP